MSVEYRNLDIKLERERLKQIRLKKMNNDIQNGIVKKLVGRPRKYT